MDVLSHFISCPTLYGLYMVVTLYKLFITTGLPKTVSAVQFEMYGCHSMKTDSQCGVKKIHNVVVANVPYILAYKATSHIGRPDKLDPESDS